MLSKYRVEIGEVVEIVEAEDETSAIAMVRECHACDERVNPSVRLATDEDVLAAEIGEEQNAEGSTDGEGGGEGSTEV